MGIRIGFSTQGEFVITSAGVVYEVSMTKDKKLNTPDNTAPDSNNRWSVYQPSGRNMVTLSVKNLSTSNATLWFSYTGGQRWTPLAKGDSWEGSVYISFFKIKANSNNTPFAFTASGV